jgi:hypothetical protein
LLASPFHERAVTEAHSTLPSNLGIWLQGPQKALLLNRTTPTFASATSIMVGSSP